MDTLYLSDYGEMLRRRWLTIAVCVLLGLAASLAYQHWAPKSYRATTSILVTPIDGQPASAYNSTNLDTAAQIVISTGTAAGAAERLHLPSSQAQQLTQRVTVTVPPNTRILQITYAAPTPQDAQRGSLAFAQAYLDQRQLNEQRYLDAQDKTLQARIDALNGRLQQAAQAAAALPVGSLQRLEADAQVQALDNQLAQLTGQQNQIHATTLTPGQISGDPGLPSTPASPNRLVTLTAGLLLGLLAGVTLAWIRHRGHQVIRGSRDVLGRAGIPVAAVLSAPLRPGEVAIQPPTGADGRGYARLRNIVAPALAGADRPVTVVAGVRHGGGPVAANLAASLARAGQDVYLLCADASTDSATALLGASGEAGLEDISAGAAASAPGVPQLRVLGRPGISAEEGLPPVRTVRAVIDRLVRAGAAVVIEAPATSSPGPDAQTLGSLASLAVLVVEAGKVTAQEVIEARTQFESVGTPVSAAVVARYGRAKARRAVRPPLAPPPADTRGPRSGDDELVPPATRSGATR